MDYAYFRDYYNYIIFMNGKVYSLKKNRFIKPFLHKSSGYIIINLSKNNKKRMFGLHQLLGECFLKNPHNFKTIDHIDINKENNKITNLRWASRKLQNINRNILKSNKSGLVGVCFEKSKNRYIAVWSINNKQIRKSFSVNKYENAKELAINYRNKMVEKHYKNII